jgi:hypothetical protein
MLLVQHLRSQPRRRGLEQRHIAFPPLTAVQQLDRISHRHPESLANRPWIGDVPRDLQVATQLRVRMSVSEGVSPKMSR